MKKLIFFLIGLFPFIGYSQLTGYWKTDTGGCYQLRQDGNEVYWAAEEGSGSRAKNVFTGTVFDNQLCGTWCDLPSHKRNNCGERIVLRIEGNRKMTKTFSSVTYNGSVWTKQSGPCENGKDETNYDLDINKCFKKTSNMIIPKMNLDTLYNLSVNECKQKCLDDPRCRSIDYKFTQNKCFTQDVKLEDVSNEKAHKEYDHYENICR